MFANQSKPTTQRGRQSPQLLDFVCSSLAATNRRPKNIRVEAVVISELKFRDIQRQVFGVAEDDE